MGINLGEPEIRTKKTKASAEVEKVLLKHGFKNILLSAGKVTKDKKDDKKGVLEIIMITVIEDGPTIAMTMKEHLDNQFLSFALSKIAEQARKELQKKAKK